MTKHKTNQTVGNWTESYHVIRHHKTLKPIDKLLFEELCTLAKNKGYCFAKTQYLAECLSVSEVTIKRSKARLRKKQLIYYQNNHTYINWEAIDTLHGKQYQIDTQNGIKMIPNGGTSVIPYNNISNKTIYKAGGNNINKELNTKEHKTDDINELTDFDNKSIELIPSLEVELYQEPQETKRSEDYKFKETLIETFRPLFYARKLKPEEYSYLQDLIPEELEAWEYDLYSNDLENEVPELIDNEITVNEQTTIINLEDDKKYFLADQIIYDDTQPLTKDSKAYFPEHLIRKQKICDDTLVYGNTGTF